MLPSLDDQLPEFHLQLEELGPSPIFSMLAATR